MNTQTDAKPFWKSMTFWVNLGAGAVTFAMPAAQGFIANHPVVATVAGVLANIMLRFKTNSGVTVS